MPKEETATLKVNDKAPDFELKGHDGSSFTLSQMKGAKNVVIFFYPKDDSPGCTAQSCLFRDWHKSFEKYDAELVGISSDSTDSHVDFAKKHDLPYLLLSDSKGTVRKRYGVTNDFGIIPGRATLVIDKNQIVRNIFVSQFNIDKHINGALKALEAIVGENTE